MPTQELSLEAISIYGGTQARVQTTDEAVESYADEMNQGTVFPPIIVYFDGATHWLADGFHRYLATKRCGKTEIKADVFAGGRTDALRHALGANSTNGVYRNNADKRNAVEIALEEWPDRANPVIAEICRVSPDLVRRVRSEMTRNNRLPPREALVGRDGKEHPAAIERQPRGKTEASSRDEAGGGKGGGGFSKGKGDPGALGGTGTELEREAREMARKGELNPFELQKMMTANGDDYAITVMNLLATMRPDLRRRREGLIRIKQWIERNLAGVPESVDTPAATPPVESSGFGVQS